MLNLFKKLKANLLEKNQKKKKAKLFKANHFSTIPTCLQKWKLEKLSAALFYHFNNEDEVIKKQKKKVIESYSYASDLLHL